MGNDLSLRNDEEAELRGLLRQALGAPARPLAEAQTERIVRGLRVWRARREKTTWALLPATVCLTLVITFGLLGAGAGPVRDLAIALAVCNLGLSPIAVLAVIRGRRSRDAT